MYKRALAAIALATLPISSFGRPDPAFGAEPPSCKAVRFADVGWTDITSTTATASQVLSWLGYAPSTQLLSVPVTYASLKAKNIDVFLGNWMPTMAADREPDLKAKAIEVIGPNLKGAKYTLAVTDTTYDEGLRSFSDIKSFAGPLGGKIYGIEPGNDGNRLIGGMIKDGKFGLKNFEMVESSEQGMLAQVERSVRRKQPIVFLGWEPHPMNTKFKIKYLSGADDVFGPNYGGAEVFTNVRSGFTTECPNVGRFISNLTFSLGMENAVMGYVLFDKMDAAQAAEKWLKANPDQWKPWLAGVTTVEGGNTDAVLRQQLSAK